MTPGRAALRQLSFREVNRAGTAGYDAGLQRHHLLPRQLLGQRCFGALFDAVGCERVGYHDFRANGLLLPASEATARRTGLPLHRGPHRAYNGMVIERVGQIERGWAVQRGHDAFAAREQATMRLRLLQGALRRRLLAPDRRPIALNRRALVAPALDFAELDAMAEALWGVCGRWGEGA